ncbi:MAG: ABC-2 type transport system ATP-binding protein [Polaribacter sp.]|jgi:ABC-2 type transport system ATP-binding protein
MNVIEIDNIELNFGASEILKSIYLKSQKGKITGVLGRNGSGKTSLLKIIFGSLKPKNKLIRIDNKPILRPLFRSKKATYLPQFNAILGRISIKKAFYHYQVNFLNFLEEFPNFKQLKESKMAELSGGERRVIEIYLTLFATSEIILLDEPFSHVAPLYIKKIKDIIQIQKQHKIIIITDHLYKEIIDVSDSIYLIKNGWSKLIKNPEDLIFNNYINTL